MLSARTCANRLWALPSAEQATHSSSSTASSSSLYCHKSNSLTRHHYQKRIFPHSKARPTTSGGQASSATRSSYWAFGTQSTNPLPSQNLKRSLSNPKQRQALEKRG